MIKIVKKMLMVISFLLFIGVLQGCQKTIYFQARPEGYGLVSENHVGKGTLLYDSYKPYNVNELTLTLYMLPHVWAEIQELQASTLELTDPDFIVFDEVVGTETTRRAFVKHILMFNETWTASKDGDGIVYRNQVNDTLLDVLNTEQKIKDYIEEIESGQIYILDHDNVMLFGYDSKHDDGTTPYQIVSQAYIVNINYTETLNALPDWASHFPTFDSDNITTLFERAYAQRNNPQYKFLEYTK